MIIFPDKPFCKTVEFKGRLINDKYTIPELHFAVQYNPVKNEIIKGAILGTPSIFNLLKPIVLNDPSSCQIRSDSKDVFECNHLVFVDVFKLPYAGRDKTPNAVGKIVNMNLADFTHSITADSPQTERRVIFFITGPTRAWSGERLMVHQLAEAWKIDSSELDANLFDIPPFSLKIAPHHFSGPFIQSPEYHIKTTVLTLEISSSISRTDLNDTEFLAQAISITDDLLLIFSFVSRHWVAWYAYEFQSSNEIKYHTKQTRQCKEETVDYFNFVVPQSDLSTFYETALLNYRTLRVNDFSLFMPIIYSINGTENTYVENQFSNLFLSLEKLIDLYKQKNKLAKILPQGFNDLERLIKETIKQQINDPITQDLIIQKIPELNRPSFFHVLNCFLNDYNIPWQDLYPPGGKFTLHLTRNRLFHTSTDIDNDELFRELNRLRSLVDRILLSLLGSRNFSNAPNEFIKSQIINPN